MLNNFETIDNFPTWALYYAYYGEDDSLTAEEMRQIDDFLGGRSVVASSEEVNFTWRPAFGLASDVCEVTLTTFEA